MGRNLPAQVGRVMGWRVGRRVGDVGIRETTGGFEFEFEFGGSRGRVARAVGRGRVNTRVHGAKPACAGWASYGVESWEACRGRWHSGDDRGVRVRVRVRGVTWTGRAGGGPRASEYAGTWGETCLRRLGELWGGELGGVSGTLAFGRRPGGSSSSSSSGGHVDGSRV